MLLGGDDFTADDAVAARLTERLLGSWERELAEPERMSA